MVKHFLTFDIEEWFHLVGVKAMADRSRWDEFERIVEPKTEQILALLDEYQVSATFFVLGWVAERYPRLVRKIAGMGHELASHSHLHHEVYKQTRESFRQDLGRSIRTIQDACGLPVYGFRAPSFSLIPGCEWAWDAMLDEGLVYDASVFPVARAHGGYPLTSTEATNEPFKTMPTPSGRSIKILPMSVMRLPVLGKKLAFSGGGYFRVWPWSLVKRGFAEHDRAGKASVVYLHPWDFAPDGPVLPMKPQQRFKCYFHRDQTEARLRELLEQYRFGACREQIELPNQTVAAA